MRAYGARQHYPRTSASSSLARPNISLLGSDLREHPILHLQRAMGNQAVQRMSQTQAPNGARRFGSGGETPLPAARPLGGGCPLSGALRSFFEPRLGRDLGAVRIHTDGNAAAAAENVDARAFTVGRDVVFGAGEYRPDSAAGRRLLAHELVHVVQQDDGRAPAVLQRQARTHWRVSYKTKAEAQVQIDYVKSLGKSDLLKLDGTIKVDPAGPVQEKDGWTFYYFPLTEPEAKAAMAGTEAKVGKTGVFTVTFNKRAASFYLQPKCPDAAPGEAGWTPWSACFPTEDKAKAQAKKIQAEHIEAKTGELQKDQFYVLFRPLTEAEAKAKGEAEAKTHRGFAEGMFTVKTRKVLELGSSTFDLDVNCPKGFTSLGKFKITSYFTAVESVFPKTPTKKDPCVKGTFRERFLHNGNEKGDTSPFGVDTEGNGLTLASKIIHRESKDCYKEVPAALGVGNRTLTIGTSVAVDKTKIPIGSQLLIQDVGLVTADDVGGKVKGSHIDLFKGLFDVAKDTTLEGRLVCQKQKP